MMRFQDRTAAGRELALKLASYANRPGVLVLGLPRGGVPIAFEVAEALNAELDVFLVRKLGTPGRQELAMGAIATGGIRVLNSVVINDLRISKAAIEQVTAVEQQELERREHVYRGGRPRLEIEGRTVIVVDDGLATGSTMRAAVVALRQQQPARLIVAVPVSAPETCNEFKAEVDEVVCAKTPQPFYAVGYWYENFPQTSDREVCELLKRAMSGKSDESQRMVQAPSLGNFFRRFKAMPDLPEVMRSQVNAIRRVAQPLTGKPNDYDSLMDLIGDARFVLIGDASHGTHEFYRERAQITKRLIQEKGFAAVAVEADWPDAYRVNRYVQGSSDAATSIEALDGFKRFPSWMWRNTDVLDFVNWLHDYNHNLDQGKTRIGFYGLDLYSLHSSMAEVLDYLDKVDPEAAKQARQRYSCFEHFGEDSQEYGYATNFGLSESCEDEVVNQLLELQHRTAEYTQRNSQVAEDEFFYAEQNARLVKNAEEYYRSMFRGRVSSWNLRDRHMAETLDQLVAHLDQERGCSKVVVWEHNSHLGDARATDMGAEGELNVGQLVRERYGDQAILIGFSTYTGTVTAASNWGESAQLKRVRPALKGSYEALFHEVEVPCFWLNLRENNPAVASLRQPHLERAIGVIYRPETERVSHYFYARLPEQFDAVLHLDETRGVEPLERTTNLEANSETDEAPETFPSAL
ncbi:erythromycin esterase family protein [Leptolyngbya sp. FACHB-261]|uniref:erythromycin esterase family protein n=1 Tax=Leptolyngbya sp. FACHB-261 TaxID=2692806 RepID=UPI0016882312|nr:erythromycin esterase family protein [Leptolyngbya sp. FACHB-261]MBD2103895.1 erythromycin esterase family protein [Leptolyngbya sp. FACHB-261]